MKWTLTLPLCVLILLAAAGSLYLISSTEPTAKKSGAVKESAMLVEVVTATQGDHRPTIVALGLVRPVRAITLAPRVAGMVTGIAEAFRPGGRLAADTVAVELDRSDYVNAERQRQSDVTAAASELAIAEGRHRVAAEDYRAFDEELPSGDRRLALREPQLEAAQARLAAAEAALAQSRLELQRTRIRTPFDALVIERHADLGSQVGAGEPLARLVGTEAYWVEATVPLRKLAWIAFPDAGSAGAPVVLRNRSAWPAGVSRTAQVDALIGSLDRDTRLARVLIRVADPLGDGSDAATPRLILGEMLEARISGRPLQEVIKLPRRLLRSGDTVWEMHEGVLKIRDVTVAFRDEGHVYIEAGLAPGAQVVTTDLATVVDGAALRLQEEEQEEEQEETAKPSDDGAGNAD